MEKMLLKLAQQLDSIDEASLMNLWSKYATITERFAPTRQWEESALVFGLIQAKHWKNQLFNYMFARTSKPHPQDPEKQELDFGFSLERKKASDLQTGNAEPMHKCRVLSFRSGPKTASPKDSDPEE